MSSQRTAAGLKDELALETLGDTKEYLKNSQTEEEEEEEARSGNELFFGDTPTTAMKNNYDPTKFVSAWYDGEEDGMVIEQEQDGTLALGMEKVEETGGFKDELALMDGPAMKMKGAGAEDSPSSEMMDDEANKESETFRGVGVGSPKVEEGTMVVSRTSVALLRVSLLSVKWLFNYALTQFSTFISASGTGKAIR